MKEIYLISGLGSDERVFQFLRIKNANLHFVRWISPLNNESIQSYAMRLREQIKGDRPVIIGLSFGGMIAVEIAKQIETTKVILLSSAKGRREIPPFYRLAGKMRLHKLIPYGIAKRLGVLAYSYFGVLTDNEKKLFKSILKDSDTHFLKWAIGIVVTWKNETTIPGLKHIHGNADRVLPIRYIKADVIIEHGMHMMVVNRAIEVSEAINELL